MPQTACAAVPGSGRLSRWEGRAARAGSSFVLLEVLEVELHLDGAVKDPHLGSLGLVRPHAPCDGDGTGDELGQAVGRDEYEERAVRPPPLVDRVPPDCLAARTETAVVARPAFWNEVA